MYDLKTTEYWKFSVLYNSEGNKNVKLNLLRSVQICACDISSLHVTMISSRCDSERFEEPVAGCL